MDSRQWLRVAAGAGAVGMTAWQIQRRRQARAALLPPGPRQRLVILGGGFGGIALVNALRRRLGSQNRLELFVVDRHNFNLFTPMLYQVATTLVDPDNITYPLRSRLRAYGTHFQESRVQGIDLNAKVVVTDDGPIPYDFLVIALGSVTNFFGMEKVARQSFTLKTLGDGVVLRNRIIDMFEQADVTPDPDQRRALLTFNIVGAGSTGVEFATSLDNLVQVNLMRDYPNVRPGEVRIRLIEAMDRAVPEMSRVASTVVTKKLRDCKIDLLLNRGVVDIEGDRLRASDGTLLAPGTTIWTAGVRANPIVADLPVGHGRGGRLVVNEFLQLPEHPEVFCIGDSALAHDPGTNRPAPPNAPAAMQMAELTAQNLIHTLQGLPLQSFHYRFKGELLSLGRNQAIVHVGNVLIDGFPGWVFWRSFYINQLMGWENRAGVLADWIFAYFARQRETTRLSFAPSLLEEEGILPEPLAQSRNPQVR